MKRKDVGIRRVYDARALRVIVGDKNGTLHGQAVQCCYNLLDIIHKYVSIFCLSSVLSAYLMILISLR